MIPFDRKKKTYIHFVSINSLSIIPVIRFIISNLSKLYTTYLVESFIKGSYTFDNTKKNIPIFKFNNSNAFYNQRPWFKFFKYLVVIKYIFIVGFKKQSIKIIYTPDYQVLSIAIFFKRIFNYKRIRLVYHQFELVDIDLLHGLNLFFFKFCLKNNQVIDLCIFPEINRANYFSDKAKSINNFYIFPNTCLSVDNPDVLPSSETSGSFIVGHIGNFGMNHYTNELFQAIEELSDFPITFMFIGRKSEEIKKELSSLNNPNIISIDEVYHNELTKFYNKINVGLILYKGISLNFEFCAPNKLYEYWSHGIPVIAHNLRGLLSIYGEDYMGKLIDFNNVREIKQTILHFYNNKNILPINRKKTIEFFNKNLSINNHLSNLKMQIEALQNE